MEKHNILYYTWGENCAADCIDALRRAGCQVYVSCAKRVQYDHDAFFMEQIAEECEREKADCIFTFNYFPDLSRVALQLHMDYYSWCYDSPHLTLQSLTLNNSCNHVYVFDYALYERYAGLGVETIHYLPLACNTDRVRKQIRDYRDKREAQDRNAYEHEITFLGNMYDDEYNFYDQIGELPEYITGYLDATMEAQSQIYGMDLVRAMLREDICNTILSKVKIDMGPDYRDCGKDILVSMIQKKITVTERRRLLTVLGEFYKVDHYAAKESPGLPVRYRGYADYVNEMPNVFATSKINLNISLRSIESGIPLRVIDILGAGGFCLTNYQTELPMYFENGKSIVWYESYEDLFEKVHYYLRHEEEREAIAAEGHRIVCSEFTYEKALQTIFS